MIGPGGRGATFYGVALGMAVGFITKFLVDLDVDALYFHFLLSLTVPVDTKILSLVKSKTSTIHQSRTFLFLDFRFARPLLIVTLAWWLGLLSRAG